MHQEYELLINEFCGLVKLEDAEYVRTGGSIEIEGVVMSFIYNTQVNPDLMFVYVDYGQPPEQREAQVYYELLKHNFVTFTGKGPCFTISPITGHVVYVEHFLINQTPPRLLAESMARFAEQAKDWQETHFLSGRYALRRADTPPDDSAMPFRA